MKTVKVDAALTVDGKPYGPAMLSLSPTDSSSKIPNASGAVSADGKVALRSYPDSAGIVPGTYQVYLGSDPMAMKSVPVTKPMTVTIAEAGGNVEVKLDTIPNAKPGMLPAVRQGATTAISLPRP